MLATEQHEGVGGTDCAPFELVIARPALVFTDQLAATCGGNAEHADNVRTALLARDHAALKAEAAAAEGKLTVAIEGQPKYTVTVAKDVFWSVGDSLKH